MLNHIEIMGRIVRDLELRQTTNGNSVCTFAVACERDNEDANGNRGTDFITCVAWRGTAEYLCKYGEKGRVVVVSGRLQSRAYKDKHGADRTAWEVVVDNLYFGDHAKKSDNFDEVDEKEDEELPF